VAFAMKLAWVPEKAYVGSEGTFCTFYGQGRNRGELYTPKQDDTLSETILPHLLMVPRGMIGWLVEKPCTAWEYRGRLIEKVGGNDPDNRPAQLGLSLAYLQWALTADATTTRSKAGLAWNDIFVEDCAALGKWTVDRVATTLGRPRVVPTSQQVQ
jgi:hypothetical protein